MAPRQLTDAEYRARLAEFGRLEALEPYKGAKHKILHRCLAHGVEQLVTASEALRGRGLRCCSSGANANRKAAASYKRRVEAAGKIEVVGEYINNSTAILHSCK
jgi:hypothetical protein